MKEGQQRFDTHADKLINYIHFWQASGESIKTSYVPKKRLDSWLKKALPVALPYGYKLVPRSITKGTMRCRSQSIAMKRPL